MATVGTWTITPVDNNGSLQKLICDWTSTAGGAASIAIPVNGFIMRVVTDPGSPAPTDNYSVTLPDENGIDLFAGLGASNRDTANSEEFYPGGTLTDGTNSSAVPKCHVGNPTLTIAGAGNAKQGQVVIYTRR